MTSEMELPTARIFKELLEIFRLYSIGLYYFKEKNKIFCDFLSRIPEDDSNPLEVILLSCKINEILHAIIII